MRYFLKKLVLSSPLPYFLKMLSFRDFIEFFLFLRSYTRWRIEMARPALASGASVKTGETFDFFLMSVFLSGLFEFAHGSPCMRTRMGQYPHVRCIPVFFHPIDNPIRVPSDLRSMGKQGPLWVPYQHSFFKPPSSFPLVVECVTLKVSKMTRVSA